RHSHVPMPRNEDDGQRHVRRSQLLLEVEAALARQSNIHHQAAGTRRPWPVEELLRGIEQLDLQADGTQEVVQRSAYGGMIVDDKDDGRGFAHWSFLRAGGSVNRNTAPCGELGEAQSRPPCASTMERQIDRPIPIPSVFVVKMGSNSLPADL